MRQTCSIWSRLTAVFVALAVVIGTGSIPLLAGQGAATSSALSGRIFQSDARTPMSDAVVKVFHRGTEEVLTSQPSSPDGSYLIEGLKAGDYDLAVSTAEGIYLVADAVRFAAGQKRAASFALKRSAQAQEQQQGEESAKADSGGEKTGEPAKEPEQKDAKKPKMKRARAASSIRTPLIATGIVVGAAVVVGAIANNLANDGDGSPNR